MSVLRNVLHDLVEKKLWPVAAALVIALVAIPVALGGTSEEPAPAPEVSSAPSAGALGARDVARAEVVSLEEQANGATAEIQRKGKVRNPFVQHHVPKAPDLVASAESIVSSTNDLVGGGSSSGGSTSSSSAGDTSTASTGGGSTGPSGGTTAPAPKKTPAKADPAEVYDVTLSFGESGEQKAYEDIARLTPLPSSTNAFVVFLGVKSDGKTAMFLVSSDAVLTGDGKCRPNADSCETLELKAGETEFLDLQTGTAGVVQYQLDVEKIAKHKASSKAKAAAARARESKAGREVLRAAVAGNPGVLDAWQFSKSLGVLVEREPAEGDAAEGDVAHLPAGVADAADGDEASTAPQLGDPAAPAAP